MDVAIGEGVFLLEATRRLRELGATTGNIGSQLYGAEISKWAYKKARERLFTLARVSAENTSRIDFFDTILKSNPSISCKNEVEVPLVQAVVGNPPFVKNSLMNRETRDKAVRRAKELGVELKGPVDASVLFLIHASTFLSSTGRLALVMPERLLFTKYGSVARDFLHRHFRSVKLVLCNGWSFDEAAERVVLVLATNSGDVGVVVEKMNYDGFPYSKTEPHLEELGRFAVDELTEDKWSMLRFNPNYVSLLQKLITLPNVHRLKDFATVEIGCVTGANDFFVVNTTVQKKRLLPKNHLVKAVSKARHIRGLFFRTQDWNQLVTKNENCMLLRIDARHPRNRRNSVQKYIRKGRDLGINARYKLSHRPKWYSIPNYRPPTAFFTYMSHRYPRLVMNSARAINTNSLHSVRLKVPQRTAFCAGFYNTLTLLSCELLGRVYNGGVLKLEPSELKRVLVVNPTELGVAEKLIVAKDRIHGRLLRGDQEGVLDLVDHIVLREGLRLSDAEMGNLRKVYFELQRSRVER